MGCQQRTVDIADRTVLLIGTLIGLGIWLIPVLLGLPDPWDGGRGYPLALLAGGAALGFVGSGRARPALFGIFGGQFLVLIGNVVASPGTSELWVVSALFLAGYTFVVAGLGVVLGGFVRERFPGRQDDEE